MAEVVELHKLKLAELKQECAARGLNVKGNKAELIVRLQEYLEEHGDDEGHEEDVNEEEVLGEDTEESPKREAPIGEKPTDAQTSKPEGITEKKVVKINPLSPLDERLQKRAERFNVAPSADSKKAMRAARFGLPVVAPVTSQGNSAISKVSVSVDVLKKRAERFGMNVSSISKKVEEEEKLKKRKERFGATTTTNSAEGEDFEAKKRKRAERFGNV
ncbi:hypothetical protein GJAV_G00194500 [Gymnothorax javanicus]|nr:hypothetical protein GJAV_G00194500 [Gymnothorax javanicus]